MEVVTPFVSASAEEREFIPIICVSASQQVHDGVERRFGYVYVQGSGDDHEMWSDVRSTGLRGAT